MNKLQQLLKDGNLAESLMDDAEFIEGAKKIFKEENIEISNEKLKELMHEIEKGFKSADILDDVALEEVSGGLSKKEKIAKVSIRITSIALGAVLGSVGGFHISSGIGNLSIEKLIGMGAASSASGIGGAYLGNKLGKLICKKLNLIEY